MKNLSALALLVLLVSGCGKNLRPDPSLPVIDAGYPSLEVLHNGKIHNGGTILSVKRGDDLSQLDLAFQGYYEGIYRLSSQRCELDSPGSFYEKNALVRIPLKGIASKDCVITITMSPSYPKGSRRGVEVDSFRGHIVIKVTDGEDWYGEFIKVTGSWKHTLRIFVGGSGPARIIADACGVSYDREVQIVDGFIEFEISEAVSLLPGKSCILDGAIITEEYEDYLFNVFVANYKTMSGGRPFSPLNFPIVKDLGDKIEVIASDVVSVVALDNQYSIDYKETFKFDRNKTHILRAMTVMGRLVIGIYEPGKEWRWLQ